MDSADQTLVHAEILGAAVPGVAVGSTKTDPFALFNLDDPATAARRIQAARQALAAEAAPLVPGAAPSVAMDWLPYHQRVLADSSDRVAWLKARARGVTATDAARLTTAASIQSVAYDKRRQSNSSFSGSSSHGASGSRITGGSTGAGYADAGYTGSRTAYLDHGLRREPIIAQWVSENFGISHSNRLYHSAYELRHMATPDGLKELPDGGVELCEIKTTSYPWRTIPRHYLRQIWWQQYVLGAERTLLVWEQHEDFKPVASEPQIRWIDRDEDQIAILVNLATELIAELTGRRA